MWIMQLIGKDLKTDCHTLSSRYFPIISLQELVTVTNCHLGFSWILVFQGCVWVCVCLGVYAFLVFPRFLCAVKCAVAGSLIATCV
jgi:hypothetical protein